jgi:enoyl-CoA hydratase/carnithine racemase
VVSGLSGGGERELTPPTVRSLVIPERLSLNAPMETLKIERQGPVAVVRLQKARGNAIDAVLVDELVKTAAEITADKEIRGVLLASGHPKLFSPGLDLVSLSALDRPAMRHFMGRFAEMLWALYTLRRPVVAAVNGAAVAGGCVLALTADYRVLKRGAAIGLNEVKVGVPLPWSVALLLRASVPPPAIAKVALLGRNFADDEALAVGLADEIVPEEGFEAACLARLQEFVEKDPHSLAVTKSYVRTLVVDEMRAREAYEMDNWLDGWFSDATRARMKETVAALTKKG